MSSGAGRRIVVTGGAGLIGSHLCDRLLARGDKVVCVDNLLTSDGTNLTHLADHPGFTHLRTNVSTGLDVDGTVDAVLHFASPASPVDYLELPVETLLVGSQGTYHCLALAERQGARMILASTSEVYGDPLEHPQTEGYWGNVNPIGPRGVYDEAKRFAEAMTMAFRRDRGVDTGIVRIFNTYGPRMRPADGRVVSNFVVAALRGEPLTVYGDGLQTRSFCFVDDEVDGIVAMLDSDLAGPVNIGNPAEFTMRELATMVIDVTASTSRVVHLALPEDDPTRRRPDITLAQTELGWKPEIELRDGLVRTAAWFRDHLGLA